MPGYPQTMRSLRTATTRRLWVAILAVAVVLPALAHAAAPEPLKRLDLDRFMGRWYEIVRTPNGAQKNCHGAYQVWSRGKGGSFAIDQFCHPDSRGGPAKHFKTAARLKNSPTNAKFEASFFGGLIRKDYWVIDRADDYTWMIASTADGKFVSLLARKPGLPAQLKADLKARIRALGFVTNALEDVGA